MSVTLHILSISSVYTPYTDANVRTLGTGFAHTSMCVDGVEKLQTLTWKIMYSDAGQRILFEYTFDMETALLFAFWDEIHSNILLIASHLEF